MTRDVTVELKALRLHGMAGAWADLVEQGTNSGLDSSRWLIEHLLQAEGTDRAMRSVNHQMHAAKFPVHRDMAGFDFEVSPVDRKLVTTLATTGSPCSPCAPQRFTPPAFMRVSGAWTSGTRMNAMFPDPCLPIAPPTTRPTG
jgi:hypothetical protein